MLCPFILYNTITHAYAHEHFITYICVDMCEWTNQSGHMTTQNKCYSAESYIIIHAFA